MQPALKHLTSPADKARRAYIHHCADTYTSRDLAMLSRFCREIDTAHHKQLAVPMKSLKAHSRSRH
jgi:hypothetical protein